MDLFIRNAVANFSNSFITALFGFLAIPFLIRGLGAESYGVVAFYGTIQAAVLVLDLGWTALNGRQIALQRTKTISAADFEEYFKSVQIIFYITVVLVLFLGIWFSTNIAGFISTDTISLSDLSKYIAIMIVTASFKFIVALYRSALIAYERQVEVALINMIIITLRHIFPLLPIFFLGYGLEFFIWWQLIIAFIEYIIYVHTLKSSINFSVNAFLYGADFRPLKSVYKFSAIVALTSGLWMLTSQVDRVLIVSNFSLIQFGYYVPLIMTAGLIQMVATPIATAIRPKLNMSYQISKDKGDDVLLLGAKIISCLTIPASTVLFFSSDSIVLFLLGSTIEDGQFTELSSILRSLAIANMLTSISANLYYYQVALGNLKWHLISAVIHPIILIPILYFCIFEFGMIGAGYAILVTNSIIFLFFIPIFISLGFSKILEWIKVIFFLIFLIYAETYCFDLFLDSIVFLNNKNALKTAIIILNAIVIIPLCFYIISDGLTRFQNPISVFKKEFIKIQ